MSKIEVFTRCSGGCLFSTRVCPRDGWSSEDTRKVFDAKARLKASGVIPTVARLREDLVGKVDQNTLDWLVEVNFPDENSITDCFIPLNDSD